MKLSAIILTKNNEDTIVAVISSLKFCDEIIIVDDFSSDQTVDLIKANPKLKVFHKKLDNDFSQSRNFGLSKAQGDWVLFIDSDEYISQALQQEIVKAISQSSPKRQGFSLSREDTFLGRKLRFGETGRIKLVRLTKRDAGKWMGNVHEKMVLKGSVGTLKNPILHQRSISTADFIDRINWYSTLVAQEKIKDNQTFSWIEFWSFPALKFFQNYFLRIGFLDGISGLIIAFLMSFHSFLVRCKMYEKK